MSDDVCTLALLLHFIPNLFNEEPGKEELILFFAVRLFTYTQGT